MYKYMYNYIKMINNMKNMPMPSNLYYWWNFGSLLGICLIIQLLSGIFLSMYYENNMTDTFDSINQIERNISMGWQIRSMHANGASLFFIFIYMHLGRNIYFKSFSLKYVWTIGSIILVMMFLTAFIGYVLPWGQMSFWGATVITNLLTSIPYAGKMMTIWLWGNFSIEKATLMRFFTLHFIMPFLISVLAIIHILFLHETGSNNPLGTNSNMDKIPFQPYFSWKDLLSMLICLMFFLLLLIIWPTLFMDPDNFIPANSLVTPPHIQPEWYFLFAYAILRTIPNKLGGVMALMFSIMILILLPLIMLNNKFNYINNLKNKLMNKIMFFFWMNNFIYLTIMGSMPIESPYNNISILLSILYFMFFITLL